MKKISLFLICIGTVLSGNAQEEIYFSDDGCCRTIPAYTQHASAQSKAPFIPSFEKEWLFPKAEYEHYMNIIKEIDPTVYRDLKNDEKTISAPCLIQATQQKKPGVGPLSEDTFLYPFITMASVTHWPISSQKSYIKWFVCQYKEYKKITPITPQERLQILTIIKSLAPELHKEIITQDPTAKDHIIRYYVNTFDGVGGSVSPSIKTGLPVIRIGYTFTKASLAKQYFIIGHELGHYVLDHFELTTTQHTQMDLNNFEAATSCIQGAPVNGQLPFPLTFIKAQQRINEYEADTFSVVQFKTPIAGGIEFMTSLNYGYIDPKKETFKQTHPLWYYRIEHLKRLTEIQKNTKTHSAISWKALAKKYKFRYGIY